MQRRTPEQIIAKLRQAEIELSKSKTGAEVCRTIGVHEQTHNRHHRNGRNREPAKRFRYLVLRSGCR